MRRDRRPSAGDDRPDVVFLEVADDDGAEEILDDGPTPIRRRWVLPVGVLAVVAFVGVALLTRSGDDTAGPSTPSPVAVTPVIPSYVQWPEGGFGTPDDPIACPSGFDCTSTTDAADLAVVRRAVTEHFAGASRVRVGTRVAFDSDTGAVTALGRTVDARYPNGGVHVVVGRKRLADEDIPEAAGASSVSTARVRGMYVTVIVSYLDTDIPSRWTRAGDEMAKDVRLVHGLV